MTIDERVKKYSLIFRHADSIKLVQEQINSGFFEKVGLDALEAIRELNTKLSDYYAVTLPVITVWVRDSNYVHATHEIYLTEPDLEDFLHQFRHHLQNIERRNDRRGINHGRAES